MKKFKKTLFLGALLSAMSVMAMGATNPGDSVEEITNNGNKASAGVPMEVRVNILSQGPELVLVDENGNLIDNLVLDHGTKVLTEEGKLAKESRVEKTVVMKRADGKTFSTGTSGVTGFTANFTLENAPGYTGADGTFELTKLNSGNSGVPMVTLIEFLNNDIAIKDGENDREVRTPVVSIIKAGTDAEAGLYVGTGTFVGTLTAK